MFCWWSSTSSRAAVQMPWNSSCQRSWCKCLPTVHIFRLLFKRGVSHCLATLRECQTNQSQADLNSFPLEELEETTGTPLYYVDEDYPAGPGITEPLPEWRVIHSGEWCLRLVLHTRSGASRNEWMDGWMTSPMLSSFATSCSVFADFSIISAVSLSPVTMCVLHYLLFQVVWRSVWCRASWEVQVWSRSCNQPCYWPMPPDCCQLWITSRFVFLTASDCLVNSWEIFDSAFRIKNPKLV